MSVTTEELVKAAKAAIKEIDVAEARRLQAAGVRFIDVREAAECAKGAIDGAAQIPRGLLEFKLGSEPALADKAAPLVIYCQSGGRSALAADVLQRLGYTAVMSMAGGYTAWSSGG